MLALAEDLIERAPVLFQKPKWIHQVFREVLPIRRVLNHASEVETALGEGLANCGAHPEQLPSIQDPATVVLEQGGSVGARRGSGHGRHDVNGDLKAGELQHFDGKGGGDIHGCLQLKLVDVCSIEVIVERNVTSDDSLEGGRAQIELEPVGDVAFDVQELAGVGV